MDLQELVERIERWKQRKAAEGSDEIGSEEGEVGQIVDDPSNYVQDEFQVDAQEEAEQREEVEEQGIADLSEQPDVESVGDETEDQTTEIDVDTAEEIE